MGSRNYDYICSVLKNLYWLPVESRMADMENNSDMAIGMACKQPSKLLSKDVVILALTFKAHETISPKYL